MYLRAVTNPILRQMFNLKNQLKQGVYHESGQRIPRNHLGCGYNRERRSKNDCKRKQSSLEQVSPSTSPLFSGPFVLFIYF